MLFNHKNKSSGVSVVELIMVSAVIIGSIALLKTGVYFVNELFFSRSKLESQRQAQEILYQISKDIRGARYIIDVSPTNDFIKMRSYDHSLHQGVVFNGSEYELANPDVFDSVKIGTVTYEYVSGSQPYLRWKVEYPNRTIEKELLKGLLYVDDPNTADKEFLFNTSPPDASPPYQSIQIILRIALGPKKDQIKIFRAVVSMRSKPVPVIP